MTLTILEEYEIFDKVVFLATDGARVMTAQEGLQGKLKKLIPSLISVHCAAHRLSLGVKELWN